MKAALCVAALALTGCASLPENTFHALNAVDQMQSINAISHDCYREVNPVTRGLFGEKPTSGEFVAYGLAISVGFHYLTRMEFFDSHPKTRAILTALAIGAKGWQVAHNADIGMNVTGQNEACR